MKISDEHKKLIPYVLGTLGLLIMFPVAYWMIDLIRHQTRPLTHRKLDLSAKGYFSELSHSFGNIQATMNRIRNSAEENEKLRLENINLRLSFDSIRNICNAKAAEQNTKTFELKLSRETGVKVGRSLASINYQAPTQLSSSQLNILADAYFIAREDEKAVVLFTLLTGQEGEGIYKTANLFLLTGVAWYRIENYSLADAYFDEVLKFPENDLSLQSQAQARLWKALVAEKLDKKIKTQYWLKELLDHHPNSNESKWINVAEGKQGAPVERHAVSEEKHGTVQEKDATPAQKHPEEKTHGASHGTSEEKHGITEEKHGTAG